MMTMSKTTNVLGLICIASLAALSTGCLIEVGIPAEGNKQYGEINAIRAMQDMRHYRDQQPQPIFRDDQPEGMRYPPASTVPVTGVTSAYAADIEAAAQLANPVAATESTLNYGQFLYNTNCAVCHGQDGAGMGTIVVAGAFSQPPTLLSDRLRGSEDGRIFHIITFGQGAMWPYKNQLTPMERWAVVNYVRALQRADYPEPADLDRMRGQ